MLEGMLTVDALRAYNDLLAVGSIPIRKRRQHKGIDELVDKGFAREVHDGRPRIIPVVPPLEAEELILGLQRLITEQHLAIFQARRHLEPAHRSAASREATGDELTHFVRLIAPFDRLRALIEELCLMARSEVIHMVGGAGVIDLAHAPVAEQLREQSVNYKVIFDKSVLQGSPGEQGQLKVPPGLHVRIADSLPTSMLVFDGTTALVPLGSGSDGSLLLNVPAVAALLTVLFERIWSRATPIASSGSCGAVALTSMQEQILGLCIAGLTDGAIARQLGVSERTVRRYVSDLLAMLGAENRVSAAAIAVREGWVS